MEDLLDYGSPEPSTPRQLWRKVLLASAIAAGCVLLIVALLAIWIGTFVHQGRLRIQAFDQKTAATVVVGKTPQQIIALLGTPEYDTNNDPPGTWHPDYGQRVILYLDGTGETARIVVNNGVATEVSHYSK